MKRLLCLILSLSCSAMVFLCGCGSSESKNESAETSAASSAAKSTVKPQSGESRDSYDTKGSETQPTKGKSENTLQKENFSTENGYIVYTENGQRASISGIDISSYCGEIDWNRVKSAGIDFVMVRLGGRGYGEKGEIYKDDRALEYIKGAQAQGIKAGGYFFSQATTTNEAIEEADYVKEILGDTKLDFPVAYDWEIIKDEEARTDKVTPAQATECARAFCQEAASYGYTPMIYSTSRELYFKYDLTKLANYDIWYCEYANTPELYYQFSMWQYSETGKVDGIEGNVDLNICFTGVAKYAE